MPLSPKIEPAQALLLQAIELDDITVPGQRFQGKSGDCGPDANTSLGIHKLAVPFSHIILLAQSMAP